jgi:signal transduction histidine kinase
MIETSDHSSDLIGSIASRSPIDYADLKSILSNLSQELCRPLSSLRAGFDLLLAESATPISTCQRGHVHTMVNLCDELLRLTRSSLDYAGLVQGLLPLSFGAYTIGALIREIDRQFEPIAKSRRIVWGCALDGPDTTVTTDASRCQRIFGNLIENALNATHAGGRVQLTGKTEGQSWNVTIEDDGPGIPAIELNRVFEPYYRLARTDQTRVEGSGLGLSTCREMVGQLGGEIQIQSNVGEGTRVVVKLPCEPLDPPGNRPATDVT